MCSGVAVSGMAIGHHSFGMFEMDKTITVQGTVQDYEWNNPHIWIDVVAADPVTHVQTLYPIEGNSVAIQQQMGWTRDSLKPGDKIAIVFHPLRNGQPGGALASASVNGVQIGHDIHFQDRAGPAL